MSLTNLFFPLARAMPTPIRALLFTFPPQVFRPRAVAARAAITAALDYVNSLLRFHRMLSRACALTPATRMQAALRSIHRLHLVDTSLLPHAGLVPEQLAARYRHLPSFHHTLHLIFW